MDILDRENSVSSQIYSVESSPEGRNSQASASMRETLQKLNTKSSELLEKIIIFYGYYIDKYGRETLNDVILRDINGQNK